MFRCIKQLLSDGDLLFLQSAKDETHCQPRVQQASATLALPATPTVPQACYTTPHLVAICYLPVPVFAKHPFMVIVCTRVFWVSWCLAVVTFPPAAFGGTNHACDRDGLDLLPEKRASARCATLV